VNHNPSVTVNDIHHDQAVAIYEYGRAHQGYVPVDNKMRLYIDVPFATLRRLPSRPITSTGHWAPPLTRLVGKQ